MNETMNSTSKSKGKGFKDGMDILKKALGPKKKKKPIHFKKPKRNLMKAKR